VLEAGQLFLPTRYASVTDVLVGGGAAGLGMLLMCRFRIMGNGREHEFRR
jgi:VanZ family protein